MFKKIFTVLLLSGFLIILCLSMPVTSHAAGLCCQLSSGVQESLSGVAAPASGEFTAQVNYSFTRMDTFKEGTSERSLVDLKYLYEKGVSPYSSLPVNMDMMKYTLTAGYGFTPKLKAFVSIPFVRNTMDMAMGMKMTMGMMTTTTWSESTMEPVSDLGDITLMGLYRLRTDRDIKPSSIITLGVGLKTPSGEFTVLNSKKTGYIHAHMQPGTGSLDPLVSLMYAKMTDSFLLQSDVTYQYSTRNRNGYEFGDSLAANLTGTYAVIRQFSITAGLTYLHTGSASDQDGKYTSLKSLMDDPRNTGGNSLWFSPGIRIVPIQGLSIDAKIQAPIWERVRGVQLVTDYRAIAGISYSF